jgi:hypothetical protein
MVRPSMLSAAVLFAVAPAAGAKPCSGYHPVVDYAPGSYAKLFVRELAPTVTELAGCVMPGGPLRALTTGFTYQNTTRVFRIRDVAGPIVALYQLRNGDGVPSEEETFVFDLNSGRRYVVDRAPPGVIEVTRDGAAVASLGEPERETRIVAFDPLGAPTLLDAAPQERLPAGSLRLGGRVASWLRDGARRTATLPRSSPRARSRAGW